MTLWSPTSWCRSEECPDSQELDEARALREEVADQLLQPPIGPDSARRSAAGRRPIWFRVRSAPRGSGRRDCPDQRGVARRCCVRFPANSSSRPINASPYGALATIRVQVASKTATGVFARRSSRQPHARRDARRDHVVSRVMCPASRKMRSRSASETRNARASASTTCTDGEVARPCSSRVVGSRPRFRPARPALLGAARLRDGVRQRGRRPRWVARGRASDAPCDRTPTSPSLH